jgi:hypothetical protein
MASDFHTGMKAHDGYKEHSHEVRPDHDGVEQMARELDHSARLVSADELNKMYAVVDRMLDEESLDRSQICEMSQKMLDDLIEGGQLQSTRAYVSHYSRMEPDEVQEVLSDMGYENDPDVQLKWHDYSSDEDE